MSYTAITPASDIQAYTAKARLKRLNKGKNNWCLGITMDLLLGAGPWVVGAAGVAAGLAVIYKEVDGAASTFALFNAPGAIAAISTFAGFLLVGKQGTNLANNGKVVGEFGNLSGSLINICLFLKSQISSGKSIEFLTLPDGAGSFYQTTRVGLVCATVMYVVKLSGRGVQIIPEGLPLGQDPRLLSSFKRYLAPVNGSPGMGEFGACILLISELIDEFQSGEKPSEYAVLFTQINAVTAAEGSIGGTIGYGGPYLMKYLLYTLYSLYLVLLLMTDLVPNSEYNAIWIMAVIAFSTIAFYQISERYGTRKTYECNCFNRPLTRLVLLRLTANPMKLRSKAMGQKPMVSSTCIDTEVRAYKRCRTMPCPLRC